MNKVITISREYGAGGHTIGKRVAQELGIEIYDKDIVRETVRASGFETEVVQEEEEDVSKASTFLKSLCSSSVHYRDPQEVIHEVQTAVILQFAKKGPCVILGRCADDILRESGIETLNVFIHADDLHRAVRISEMTGITNATELQKLMAKKDSSRRNYYEHYTHKKWGDSHNYDLTLDSGKLGVDLCVQMIVEAAKAEE
ncbi:cytidylate kinase-like family protein [Oscillibacter valericigenes]|uniref:cytidylate kinase-like family protein n=1 Tax=Oscillibacter valericigenes TaxID=351091 RepID=UPI001F31EA15|nr:cytidylate kinase-like family protein [Oscillibacter valericigenes]MCF2663925.1 cytidylate kinase-like family protein [Oscillibacter valericigenes]